MRFLPYRRYGNTVAVHIIPVCHGAIHVARMGSVYITMSVTLERYITEYWVFS